ncbi:hypothetical protein UPYG_G00142380 [Umbra pygmaea]|uniref:C2H2-type domain-containing protein n=1 Tax=Umbra pygmaea TaxID=75934 RepID=A0ABD0WW56_UMBPY
MTKLQLLNSLLVKQLEVTVQEVMRMVSDTVSEYVEETARAKSENARLRKKLREITLVATTETTGNPFSIYDVEDEQPESFPSLVQNRGMDRDTQPEVGCEQNPENCLNLDVKTVSPDHQKLGQELEIKMETHRLVVQAKKEPASEFEAASVDSHCVTNNEMMPSTAFNTSPPANQILLPGLDMECNFPAVQVDMGVSDMQPNTLSTARGGKRVRVSYCGKQRSHSFAAQAHRGVHSIRNRTYLCGWCGKAFYNRQDLERHERVHTGAKPFQCSFCEKSFSLFCNMKRHERLHTGERPFCCPECEKTFADQSSLRNHMSSHVRHKELISESS